MITASILGFVVSLFGPDFSKTVTEFHQAQCIRMEVSECPKMFIDQNDKPDITLAYYCESRCNIKDFGIRESLTYGRPHIVYYKRNMRSRSVEAWKKTVIHELSHHLNETKYKLTPFSEICEFYGGSGCDQHEGNK